MKYSLWKDCAPVQGKVKEGTTRIWKVVGNYTFTFVLPTATSSAFLRIFPTVKCRYLLLQ